MTIEIKEPSDVVIKREENAAKAQRDERIERFATIVTLLAFAGGLQALGAPESTVGGCIGAALGLVMPGGSRARALTTAGAGALLGAVVSGWVPGGVA